MEERWFAWAHHVLECAQCTHVLATIGHLDNHAADKLCETGDRLYSAYRVTTVRL